MTAATSSARQAHDLATALSGGAAVLLVVLFVLVVVLIRHYRTECEQLRARNRRLSFENDRWHEDFAAQSGELSALRRILATLGARRSRSRSRMEAG